MTTTDNISALLSALHAANGRHAQAVEGFNSAVAEYRGEVAHFGDAGPGAGLHLAVNPSFELEELAVDLAEAALVSAGYSPAPLPCASDFIFATTSPF